MPAVAVVAAWAGAAMGGFSVVTTIAAVVTTVGAATGNKDLMMVGGLIGGIGAIAGGLGGAAAAVDGVADGAGLLAETGGDALAASGEMLTGGMDATADAMGGVGVGDMTANATGPAADTTTAVVNSPPPTSSPPVSSQPASVSSSPSAVAPSGQPASSQAGSGGARLTDSTSNVTTSNTNNVTGMSGDSLTKPLETQKIGSLDIGTLGAQKSDDILGGLGDWFNNNKELANAGMKIIGSGLDTSKEQTLKLYKDKLAFEKQQYDTQQKNANAQVDMSKMYSANPNANIYSTGLLYAGK